MKHFDLGAEVNGLVISSESLVQGSEGGGIVPTGIISCGQTESLLLQASHSSQYDFTSWLPPGQ